MIPYLRMLTTLAPRGAQRPSGHASPLRLACTRACLVMLAACLVTIVLLLPEIAKAQDKIDILGVRIGMPTQELNDLIAQHSYRCGPGFYSPSIACQASPYDVVTAVLTFNLSPNVVQRVEYAFMSKTDQKALFDSIAEQYHAVKVSGFGGDYWDYQIPSGLELSVFLAGYQYSGTARIEDGPNGRHLIQPPVIGSRYVMKLNDPELNKRDLNTPKPGTFDKSAAPKF